MNNENAPIIVVLNSYGLDLANRIAGITGGETAGLSGRVETEDVAVSFDETRFFLQEQFTAGRPIIAIMATGALVRLLAPVLADKHNEPAVLAVSEDGASIVPILGGHHGANDLARDLSA